MAKEKMDIEKFFTDPKHKEDADFMRGAVERIIGEIQEKRQKENPENESLFDKLFN